MSTNNDLIISALSDFVENKELSDEDEDLPTFRAKMKTLLEQLMFKLEEDVDYQKSLEQQIEDLEKDNITLDEIREELRETRAELREVKTTLGQHDRLIMNELVDPIIRNTATNIILCFLGVQLKDNIDPQSFRFKDNTKNLKKLEDFIDVYEIVDNARRWGRVMDRIIANRNIRIHPSTYDMLEQDVAKCETYITNFPQLNATYADEIGVIRHYQKFTGKETPPIQTQE